MGTGYEDLDKVIDQTNTLLEQQAQEQNKIVDLSIQKAQNQANKQKTELAAEERKQGKQLYTDYQKQINQYGVNAENLASQGLNKSGYAESSKVNIYNTYQKNVTTLAVETQKLKTDVDFELNNAMLDADIQKAEIAADSYFQKMQLAMQAYEMKVSRDQYEDQKRIQLERYAIEDARYGQQRQDEMALSNSKKANTPGTVTTGNILPKEEESGVDLSGLSERAFQLLERLETAELNNYKKAASVIDNADGFGPEEKDIMKKYIKEYIDAE